MVVAPRNRKKLLHLLLRKKLLLIALLVLNRSSGKRKYKKKRFWVNPMWKNRQSEGHYRTLVRAMRMHDPWYFANFTRMSPKKFYFLLEFLRPKLQSRCFNRKDLTSPGERLALTLRFLATGGSLRSMAFAFRVGITTAHTIIKNTCNIIWEVLQPLYLEMPTQDTWMLVENGYRENWNFPMCCGVVAGKRIQIIQSAHTGLIYNKDTNFIEMMAVVDASYRFITVDVSGSGFSSNGGIFKSSQFGQDVENEIVDFPSPATLPSTQISVRHVLLGDEAFQLLPNLMRPYASKDLNDKKTVFNKRLSRARRCSENAFGILAARWTVLTKPIYMKPENAESVIRATTVLHNFLLYEEATDEPRNRVYCPPKFADTCDEAGNIIDGLWHTELQNKHATSFTNLTPTNTKNFSLEAAKVRELFTNYFNSKNGKVSWQYNIPLGRPM